LLKKHESFKKRFYDFLKEDRGLGIYCPARVINILPSEDECGLRFFDDDTELHNKYYPGFNIQIESFNNLLAHKPKKVLVASHSFGEIIANKLVQISGLEKQEIMLISDL